MPSAEPKPSKSPEDQVRELEKLVADARDSLAQVSRGLDALRDRLRALDEERSP
jgi:uncharacterized coiled-coil protein SlyX